MCPLDRPLWNSTALKCQLCPDGYPNYNRLYNRCEACPSGTGWNSTTKRCQTQVPQCKVNSYWDVSQSRCICNVGFISNGTDCIKPPPVVCSQPTPVLNPVTGICQKCPTDKPNYVPTTKQCISCPTGTTWNFNTKNCDSISCLPGTRLNSVTNNCDPINCPAGTKLNTATNNCDAITCPADKPKLNLQTNVCEACPTNSYYSMSSKNCQTCPAGSQYDPNKGQCVINSIVCPPGYFYNSISLKC